jgi:hypothetical protein
MGNAKDQSPHSKSVPATPEIASLYYGSQELAESHQFTRQVNGKSGRKSVFICVHLWFMNSWSDFNCGIQVHPGGHAQDGEVLQGAPRAGSLSEGKNFCNWSLLSCWNSAWWPRLLDSFKLPRHGESSGERSSVMI